MRQPGNLAGSRPAYSGSNPDVPITYFFGSDCFGIKLLTLKRYKVDSCRPRFNVFSKDRKYYPYKQTKKQDLLGNNKKLWQT